MPPLRKAAVLVVEDNAVARGLVEKLLHSNGYEVVTASDVSEGIAALGHEPHWLLVDILLPDGTGMEVLAEARRRRLPVQVGIMTGIAGTEFDVMDYLSEYAPDECFSKPVNGNCLLKWLQRPL